MNIPIRFALAVFALFVAGCSQENLMERFASKDDQAVANAYVDMLRARQFEALEEDIDPSIKTADLRSRLEQIAASMPEGEPTSRKLVGVHMSGDSDSETLNTTYEYRFHERWVLVDVAIKEQSGKKTIVGLHLNPHTMSLAEQNRFTFTGKTIKHYVVLAWAVAAALLSLTALVVCVRTKVPSRKWLWVVFIICGIGNLSLNWATGEMGVSLVSMQLFSAGAVTTLYGPWVVSVSLPLGAIAFLIYRKVRLTATPSIAS